MAMQPSMFGVPVPIAQQVGSIDNSIVPIAQLVTGSSNVPTIAAAALMHSTVTQTPAPVALPPARALSPLKPTLATSPESPDSRAVPSLPLTPTFMTADMTLTTFTMGAKSSSKGSQVSAETYTSSGSPPPPGRASPINCGLTNGSDCGSVIHDPYGPNINWKESLNMELNAASHMRVSPSVSRLVWGTTQSNKHHEDSPSSDSPQKMGTDVGMMYADFMPWCPSQHMDDEGDTMLDGGDYPTATPMYALSTPKARPVAVDARAPAENDANYPPFPQQVSANTTLKQQRKPKSRPTTRPQPTYHTDRNHIIGIDIRPEVWEFVTECRLDNQCAATILSLPPSEQDKVMAGGNPALQKCRGRLTVNPSSVIISRIRQIDARLLQSGSGQRKMYEAWLSR